MHCHWIPDAVLTEKCDGVAFFEAIALYKSSAEMCGGFFDLKPVQALLGDGIGIASELIWRESGYGRVRGMFEEPLPGRQIAWDYTILSMGISGQSIPHLVLRRMSLCKLLNGMITDRAKIERREDGGVTWKHAVIPQRAYTYAAIYMIATHAWCRI